MTTRHSRATERNPQLVDWTPSHRSGDNVRFFTDALTELTNESDTSRGLMAIGLLGQRDIPGVTVRQAQSVLRWDLRPSLWSHVFLIAAPWDGRPTSVRTLPLLEVTLHPRNGEFQRPERNAVMPGTLGTYRDARVDGNAALLVIQMSAKETEAVAARAQNPNLDRIRYDLWSTLGIWETYLWSSGQRPNPLREGVPVFCSAFAEFAYEAIHLDLSPGASERNSAPEHLWNAAAWWHPTFEGLGHPIQGRYVLRDKGCALLGSEELAPETTSKPTSNVQESAPPTASERPPKQDPPTAISS
jgi:hypothetical protein